MRLLLLVMLLVGTVWAEDQRPRWNAGRMENEGALVRAAAECAPEEALALLREVATRRDPCERALAQALLFEHAARLGLPADERAKLRAQLQAIRAPEYARFQAWRALLTGGWSGWEAWYLTLLKERPFADDLGSALFRPVERDPERWVPILIRRVGSRNRAEHSNAAHLLAMLCCRKPRRDAMLALLPWFENESWAADFRDNYRPWCVAALKRIDLPEAVPVLIRMLRKDHYWARDVALALIRNHDRRAIPVLRAAMKDALQGQTELRAALAACGGIPTERCVEALLAYGRVASSRDGARLLFGADHRLSNEDRLDPLTELGLGLAHHGAPDAVSVLLFRRLAQEDPKAVRALQRALFGWSSRAASEYALDCVERGLEDHVLLRRLMANRAAVQANCRERLLRLAASGGRPAGLAAALLGEAPRLSALLRGGDEAAREALLRAAAASQDPSWEDNEELAMHGGGDEPLTLPLADVRPLPGALEYLRFDDRREARRLLREAGTDRVVGFMPKGYQRMVEPCERELLEETGTDEAWALLSGGYYGGRGSCVIRRRGQEYTLSLPLAEGTTNRRPLTADEGAELQRLLQATDLDLLPSVRGEHSHGPNFIMLHIPRAGVGSRVFLGDYSDLAGRPQGRLVDFLLKRFEVGIFEPIVDVVEKVPGARVLGGDDEFPAVGVWAQGDDVRIRTVHTRQEHTGGGMFVQKHGVSIRAGDEVQASWRPVAAPLEAWPDVITFPAKGKGEFGTEVGWQSMTSAGPLLNRENGLYLGARLLCKGKFIMGNPISLGERWAVAVKLPGSQYFQPSSFVRVDVVSGEVKAFDIPPADECEAIARVPGGILVRRERDSNELSTVKRTTGPDEPEYRVLDPETMTSRVVSGEMRPWSDTEERPLQPAGPGMVWAALPDRLRRGTVVGHYDTVRFAFQPVASYPGARFRSDDMWVDEGRRLVYALCGGMVVSLPLGRVVFARTPVPDWPTVKPVAWSNMMNIGRPRPCGPLRSPTRLAPPNLAILTRAARFALSAVLLDRFWTSDSHTYLPVFKHFHWCRR